MNKIKSHREYELDASWRLVEEGVSPSGISDATAGAVHGMALRISDMVETINFLIDEVETLKKQINGKK